MNQISPFKSSAFRITLIYILLFGLSVSFILGFVYWSTIVYTTNETEEAINAELRVLSNAYERRGYPGLVTLLSDRVRIQRQRPGDSSVYLLVDEQFQTLVGNISSWPRIAQDRKDGWLDFKLGDNREGTAGEYTARARTFVIENRYNLLVGQGMRDLENLKDLVGRALIWGLFLTLGLGLIGGFMMRQTLSRRLSSINQTARKIMHGDLRMRIATKDSGDEFDELAANLNSMLDQIEGGMEGVRRVSDNIAHDLKTPLARLKNRVEELRFKVAGNSDQESSVDQIIHEADGLLATFNALLRIARIEYSEQRKGFEYVDINSLVYDIEELYEPLIEDKGQSLSVQLSESAEIWADRDMLFQAFANLLDNAIKYTPEKGLILIKSVKSESKWSLSIADNGPGIPEDQHDKVVQRFYRLDQSRTTPGSGLGLALVFAVLKVHGMDLSFSDNRPGLRVNVSVELDASPRQSRSNL
ncbi:MAG: HAMP domain-containing histidine kinase [Gammaproteobacteria bacterium]|nr:HAMP domain-containing histidine kinase [Gammaproteobacteria bacterium]